MRPLNPKVLAYVHTFNDADVIDGTMQALCDQSYPIPEILLIDNASTDGTLDRSFPDKVTIIRNQQNLGTSGAVAAGMEYAIARGYDWIYILDADTLPAPTAIENLVRCYRNLSPERQASTWWLGSILKESHDGQVHHGCVFSPEGLKSLDPPAEPSFYGCDTYMWSGSFYRLAAVKDVGLPDRDYVLDWGDVIYGYEGKVRGYTGFLDQASVAIHNLHPLDTLHFRRMAGRFIRVAYSPPIRSYYFWRNSTHFWLRVYDGENATVLTIKHFFLYFRWLIKVTLFVKAPVPILRAYVRGMWDGLRGRLQNRF